MKERMKVIGLRLKTRAIEIYRCPKDPRMLRLNHDTNLLKIIACLAMLSDHAGKMLFSTGAFGDLMYFRVNGDVLRFLFPAGHIMRIIGRLAMPMFAYGIAVGAAYSRNVWKYAIRLFIMGILVHPLYMEAMGHVKLAAFDWQSNFYRIDLIVKYYFANKGNIFFTLTSGALILGAVRSKSPWLLILFVFLTWKYQGMLDYGVKGVMLIVLFYLFLEKPVLSFVSVFLFMWYWGMPNYFTRGVMSSSIQLYALYSLPLIYLPLRKRYLKMPKWFFYAFYPGHLALIYSILRWFPGLIQILERMIK